MPSPIAETRLPPAPAPLAGRRIEVRGIVQGVGFRPWIWRLATDARLAGRVWNDPRGVVIEAFGPDAALDAFARRLRDEPPPAAEIGSVETTAIPAEVLPAFEIVRSAAGDERQVSIPADLATCDDCAREVADPQDRRYGYPFTNCTNCGPRFTLVRDVPYDRAATTMAPFAMCPRCRAEYDDPTDRRFHAQPNACPDCGPRLAAVRPDGSAIAGDPLALAAAALLGGGLVAVKGIGGFHLAGDATSEAAVAVLRERKRREEKPLAVMVADLAAAERLAVLSPADRALLGSIERPIVLLRRRPGAALAAGIAPGSPFVGLLLPYSPLHHLLLGATGKPLVMTSGNLSDEPMAIDDTDALERLGAVADLFLLHDRRIESRCDDSVARVVAGAPLLVRRSRGWVPKAIRLRHPVARPILAVGAHLKNVVALAAGDRVVLGPHVGDLDTDLAIAAFEESIERLIRFTGIVPETIAHDLHPDAASTIWAERQPLPQTAVQHHHAHVVAAMTDAGLDGPVYGVAFDGTGLGTDGTAWGGELLLADAERFTRLATLRPIRLAGGEAAIREPWRLALAMLDDAFDGAPPLGRFPLFTAIDPARLAAVRKLLGNAAAIPAHGAGRWFDAFAALALGRGEARFEGQGALEWEAAAAPERQEPWPFLLDASNSTVQVDLRPAVRAAVDDLLGGTGAAVVSARFHATLGAVVAALLARAAAVHGPRPVVLSGGCFVNARLVDEVVARAGHAGEIRLPRRVPAGDGGIALGQIVVADARARGAAA